MKKRTVITTEKREVWVVRESNAEPTIDADSPIDVDTTIATPSSLPSANDLERSQNDEVKTTTQDEEQPSL